ncbi:hypothetical protein RRG08_031805 [Elysia crispata]|uniref:Alpha-carbonic anhydrase domain-containing protein n=1 Tax=Elysia crispata TaxID=231223 RepID=A0AAE0Y5L5_9GAST|nr:hypothetical protein RRG08_031805 [Elysia crispata]
MKPYGAIDTKWIPYNVKSKSVFLNALQRGKGGGEGGLKKKKVSLTASNLITAVTEINVPCLAAGTQSHPRSEYRAGNGRESTSALGNSDKGGQSRNLAIFISCRSQGQKADVYCRANSKDPWTYDGPTEELKPSWQLCHSGKFQSPINVMPRMLLFDPRLLRLEAQVPDIVSGTLINKDHDLVFYVDNNTWNLVNFSRGPFMYGYRLSEIKIKIGKTNSDGSEHRVDGRAFSAEIQLICYNSDLTNSLRKAQRLPYGVAIISIFAEAHPKEGNNAFSVFVDAASRVPWQGQDTHVPSLRLKAMLPDTIYYVTYEGSFTQPACLETVTWVIFNKPIKIKATQLDKLRQLRKKNQERSGTLTLTNIRATMPLHNRPVRTNINTQRKGSLCNMKKDTFYQTNQKMLQ